MNQTTLNTSYEVCFWLFNKSLLYSVALLTSLATTNSCLADIVAKWTIPQGTQLTYSNALDPTSDPLAANIGSGSLIVTRQLVGTNPPEYGASINAVLTPNSPLQTDDGSGSLKTFAHKTRTATADMHISTIGHSDLMFTFDSGRAGFTPNSHDLYYSLDGTNFLFVGGGLGIGAWHRFSTDLSHLTQLNNQSSVIFRISVRGGNNSNPGEGFIDNMELSSFHSVPEPSSIILIAMGLFAMIRRRLPIRVTS